MTHNLVFQNFTELDERIMFVLIAEYEKDDEVVLNSLRYLIEEEAHIDKYIYKDCVILSRKEQGLMIISNEEIIVVWDKNDFQSIKDSIMMIDSSILDNQKILIPFINNDKKYVLEYNTTAIYFDITTFNTLSNKINMDLLQFCFDKNLTKKCKKVCKEVTK